MRLDAITLKDFRSYETASLEPAEHVTIIHGANGQGKTNILEAIHFLSTTRGFRSGRDQTLIRWGTEGCHVCAKVIAKQREMDVALAFPVGGRKHASVDGASLTRASEVIGLLHVVDFSTRDFAILQGEPSCRRDFMDLELVQLSGAYAVNLARYKRSLSQRNGLLGGLAEGRGSADELEVWDEQLATYGEPIAQARQEFVEMAAPVAMEMHGQLSDGQEELCVGYRADVAPGELTETLRSCRRADLARGSTTRGPHRDDLLIEIGGKSAKLFASQGQQRSAALALKLAQGAVAERRMGEAPVVLLDDVLSDLDEGRRVRLLKLFPGRAQMIMTCTEPGQLPKAVLKGARLVEVSASVLTVK